MEARIRNRVVQILRERESRGKGAVSQSQVLSGSGVVNNGPHALAGQGAVSQAQRLSGAGVVQNGPHALAGSGAVGSRRTLIGAGEIETLKAMKGSGMLGGSFMDEIGKLANIFALVGLGRQDEAVEIYGKGIGDDILAFTRKFVPFVGPIGDALSGIGFGNKKTKPTSKAPKAPKAKKQNKRAEIVRKVMKAKGMTLPQASKFVKDHKLY